MAIERPVVLPKLQMGELGPRFEIAVQLYPSALNLNLTVFAQLQQKRVNAVCALEALDY